MLRRDLLSAICVLPFTVSPGLSTADPAKGPHFYAVSRENSRVFLLGFGEARDDSWFSSSIQKAFDDSSSLWLEIGNEGAGTREATARIEELRQESSGRTLFDELGPAVRQRTLAYMTELGIQAESIEHLRPWRAYYTLVAAFYSNRRPSAMPVLPDEMLSKRAGAARRQIFYEMPTQLSFAEFMAAMPSIAQSQYVEWLLDYLDDVKAGRVIELDEKWIRGDFSAETRSLERMRTRMPALYRVMQVQRNAWWARKIDELLNTGKTHFVAVGNLHAMGRDGIPAQLVRQKLGDPIALQT